MILRDSPALLLESPSDASAAGSGRCRYLSGLKTLASCVLLVAVGGCKTPASRKVQHRFEVDASIRSNPRNVISALVAITAEEGARVWVEHGDTQALGDRTPEVRVPAAGSVEIPLIGLAPNHMNHARVHATSAEGLVVTKDLSFSAGPLPTGVPESVPISVNTNEATGYVLAGLADPSVKSFIPSIIDRKGRIRWYWEAPKPAETAAQFDRTSRGTFVVGLGPAQIVYELDLAGRILSSWQFRPRNDGVDTHDFLLLPNGNALMSGFEHHVVDSRPLFPRNAVRTAIRTDQTVDEMNSLGDIVFHWSSFEHVNLLEIVPTRQTDSTHFEGAHLNSIETTSDGNIVVSLRATNSVLKINRSNGSVIWRLGGTRSDFAFRDDPFDGFTRQHDARVLGSGDILLYDNGNQHVPQVSRVVCYHLNGTDHTATLTWAYRHEPDVFSQVCGSARRLPDGHTLVAFSPSLITEVDSAKRVVWESRIAPFELYRATFIPTLYPSASPAE